METIHEDKTKYSQKVLELHCMSGLKHFKKVLRSYLIFHLCFYFAFLLELGFIAALYALKMHTPLFALGIAFFVLTVFTYLSLLFYTHSKKPEQLSQLKDWFVSICRRSLSEDIAQQDYHLFMAQALHLFARSFQTKDLPVYLKSFPLESLQRVMKKLSLFLHLKDLQKMKEILLFECIQEHLSLLKIEPTNLEVHASLGNSYLTLSAVYKTLLTSPVQLKEESYSNTEINEKYYEKFKRSINKAIEEYKIIYESARDDPWVLAQLATCYHELEMYDKEIEHFEKILEVSDAKGDVMLRLAYLYFQEGLNAQGFKIYKLLKESDHERADELFSYYISKSKQDVNI